MVSLADTAAWVRSKPQRLTYFTEDEFEELQRVHHQDTAHLIIHAGDIVGVFYQGQWALVRARGVGYARGRRVAGHANRGETVVHVILTYAIDNDDHGECLGVHPGCFQRLLVASEDAVRKHATKYHDLTAFDANPKRKLRDVANLLARKESQDEGFVVGTLVEELRPGEIKNGTEAAAATATHALPVQ